MRATRRRFLPIWIVCTLLLSMAPLFAQTPVVPPSTPYVIEWVHDEVIRGGANRYRVKVDGQARDLVAADLTITGTPPNRVFRATMAGVPAGSHTIQLCVFNDAPGEACIQPVAFTAAAIPNPPTQFRFVISGTIASNGAVSIERFEVTPVVLRLGRDQ